MENPIKMDDLRVPLFLETPIWLSVNLPAPMLTNHAIPVRILVMASNLGGCRTLGHTTFPDISGQLWAFNLFLRSTASTASTASIVHFWTKANLMASQEQTTSHTTNQHSLVRSLLWSLNTFTFCYLLQIGIIGRISKNQITLHSQKLTDSLFRDSTVICPYPTRPVWLFFTSWFRAFTTTAYSPCTKPAKTWHEESNISLPGALLNSHDTKINSLGQREHGKWIPSKSAWSQWFVAVVWVCRACW